ncbi:MAG: hypothetical protein ACE5G3_01425 [Gammaproteobacteria bacterium]
MQEFEWRHRDLNFVLLDDATPEVFAGTRTSRDPRFVNVAAGTLIMSFHSLVVRAPGGTLLVDTCVGNHKDRPLVPEWHRLRLPGLTRGERQTRVGRACGPPGRPDRHCSGHVSQRVSMTGG